MIQGKVLISCHACGKKYDTSKTHCSKCSTKNKRYARLPEFYKEPASYGGAYPIPIIKDKNHLKMLKSSSCHGCGKCTTCKYTLKSLGYSDKYVNPGPSTAQTWHDNTSIHPIDHVSKHTDTTASDKFKPITMPSIEDNHHQKSSAPTDQSLVSWDDSKNRWESMKMEHDDVIQASLYRVGDTYIPKVKEVNERLEEMSTADPLSITVKRYAKPVKLTLTSEIESISHDKNDDVDKHYDDKLSESRSRKTKDVMENNNTIKLSAKFKDDIKPWTIKTYEKHITYEYNMTDNDKFANMARADYILDTVGGLKIEFDPLLKSVGGSVMANIVAQSYEPKVNAYVSSIMGPDEILIYLQFDETNHMALKMISVSILNATPIKKGTTPEIKSIGGSKAITIPRSRESVVRSVPTIGEHVSTGIGSVDGKHSKKYKTRGKSLAKDGEFYVVQMKSKPYDLWTRLIRMDKSFVKQKDNVLHDNVVSFMETVMHPKEDLLDRAPIGEKMRFTIKSFNNRTKRLDKYYALIYPYELPDIKVPNALFYEFFGNTMVQYNCNYFLIINDAEKNDIKDLDVDSTLTIETIEDKRVNPARKGEVFTRYLKFKPKDKQMSKKNDLMFSKRSELSTLFNDKKMMLKLVLPHPDEYFTGKWADTIDKSSNEDLKGIKGYVDALNAMDKEHLTMFSYTSVPNSKSYIVFTVFMKEYNDKGVHEGKYSLKHLIECNPQSNENVIENVDVEEGSGEYLPVMTAATEEDMEKLKKSLSLPKGLSSSQSMSRSTTR